MPNPFGAAARRAYRGALDMIDDTARSHGAESMGKSPTYVGPPKAATPENFQQMFLQSAMANDSRERVFDQLTRLLDRAGVPSKISLPSSAPFTDPGRGLFDYTGMGNYGDAYLRRFDLPVPNRGIPLAMKKALQQNVSRYVDDTAAGRARAGDYWYDMSPVNRYLREHPDPAVGAVGPNALTRMSAFSAQRSPMQEIPGGLAYHGAAERGDDPWRAVADVWGGEAMPVHINGARMLDERGAYGVMDKAGAIPTNPKIFPYNEAKRGNMFAYPSDSHEIQSLMPDLYVTPTPKHKGVLSMLAQELARRSGLPGPAPMMSSHWMEASPQQMMTIPPNTKRAHGLPLGMSPEEELQFWQQRYAPPFARMLEDSIVDRAGTLGRDPHDLATSAFRGDDFCSGGEVPKLAGGGMMAKWMIPYMRRLLPENMKDWPIAPIKGESSGRKAFNLGDSYVAKLWSGQYPRGLAENDFNDYLLENEGVIPHKKFVSPDAQLAVMDRMNSNTGAARSFINPLANRWQNVVMAAMDSGHPQARRSQFTAHQWDPKLSQMMDDHDLGIVKNYDILGGDFFAPRHWMQDPAAGNRMKMVDEGAMMPDLISYYSKPQNVSSFAPQIDDIVSDRSRFIQSQQRDSLMARRLAAAQEKLRSTSPDDQAAGVSDAQRDFGFAGGGVVRNWLTGMGPKLRSGMDNVMEYLNGYSSREPAVNEWVKKNYANYLKREFGTETDRLKPLVDAGHFGGGDDQQPLSFDDVKRKLITHVWGDPKSEPVVRHFANSQSKVLYGVPSGTNVNDYVRGNLPSWVGKAPLKEGWGQYFHDINDDEFFGKMGNKTADMLDYLMRHRKDDVANMSVPDAYAASKQFHDDLAAKQGEALKNQAGVVVHKEYPTGFKWVKYDPQHPDLANALKGEGNAMGHCLGDYCDDVKGGNSEIYSLRDASGQPHVTVEARPAAAYDAISDGFGMPGEYNSGSRGKADDILQIRGKGAAHQEVHKDYFPYVRDFIQSGKWGSVERPQRFGLNPVTDPHGNTRYYNANDYDDGGQKFADGGAVQPQLSPDMATAIHVSEQRNGLPPGYLSALLKTESNYDPKAVSKKGALGIAQFMPQTAQKMGFDPRDPLASIDNAGRMIRRLYGRFGDWQKAAAAYNWGEGNVVTHGMESAPPETREHWQRLLSHWIGGKKESAGRTQDSPRDPNLDLPPMVTAGRERDRGDVESPHFKELYDQALAMLDGILSGDDQNNELTQGAMA